MDKRQAQERDDKFHRRKDFIDERIKKAVNDEKHGGQYSPDVIHAWQSQGKYTYDKKYDSSRDKLANRTSLPVQERVIMPDGELVTILSDAAYEAVRDKMFCGKCEERQPESEIARRESISKFSKETGFALPNSGKDNCPYCGAILGINGDSHQGSNTINEDQKRLLGLNAGDFVDPFGNKLF